MVYQHDVISQLMNACFFPGRGCVPPTWRQTHCASCTLRFGRAAVYFASLPVCVYFLLQLYSGITCLQSLRRIRPCCCPTQAVRRFHPRSQSQVRASLLFLLRSMLLRPDLQHAFAHRGTMPMGCVLACIGPWAPAPVWSGCTCMCVVFPAPCSSVRGLLTACPVTTAVYFTSVCTNWTLIAASSSWAKSGPSSDSQQRMQRPESLGQDKTLGPGGLRHLQTHPHVLTLPPSSLRFPTAWWLVAISRHMAAAENRLPVIMLSEACPHWPG